MTTPHHTSYIRYAPDKAETHNLPSIAPPSDTNPCQHWFIPPPPSCSPRASLSQSPRSVVGRWERGHCFTSARHYPIRSGEERKSPSQNLCPSEAVPQPGKKVRLR